MISRRSFAALHHRNFRLIWIGLLVSFTGSMMQNAAILWQVSLPVPPDRAGQALVPTLVPREHLPNAIGLNTAMLQMASVAGPALAGVTIAARGVAMVYVMNAISFSFVIVALLAMRDVPDRELRRVPSPEG